jgi:glutamyl-tRNA reductase
MKFFVAGLSYKTASVDVREKVAVSPGRVRCTGCRLKIAGGLREVVLVSTCNRVEIYAATDAAFPNGPELFRMLSKDGTDVSEQLYVKEGVDAVKHLFSVTSGLDSMVLGETEISGQIKQAYLAAQESKLTGKILNRAFQTAFQVAKDIRTQTSIGRGATSVGSVAVELAERIFDQDFSTRTVMIVGAGKMGEACVRHLAKKGAKDVVVVNRSLAKAEALANEIGGRPVAFTELFDAMQAADIVVSSTGARRVILDRQSLSPVLASRGGRPLFLIDIAVPRDIADDVQELDNVYLYNIDHLQTIVAENVKSRWHELAKCNEMIADSAAELLARFEAASRHAQPAAPQAAWGFARATVTA